MFISILGRQRGISLAELEVVYDSQNVQPISDHAALLDADSVEIDDIGGTIKLAELVDKTEIQNFETVFDILKKLAERLISTNGKSNIGLSVYDNPALNTKKINNFMMKLKKSLRSQGYSIRIVPNKHSELNSAQVIRNKLTQTSNVEFVLIKSSAGYYLGRTVGVQDIDEFASRDQARPKRDAKVGMLPPKLALTMLNLAGSKGGGGYVLDPFCGTGVILQEALIKQNDVYGSDISPKMVGYSEQNLQWIQSKYLTESEVILETADATNHKWTRPISRVVSESYLGPPLSRTPSKSQVDEQTGNIDSILEAFLRNIHPQLEKGTKFCLAVPAWRSHGKIYHLTVVDHLEDLGYTRRSFEHVRQDELVYFRPNQFVARELLILERN